MIEPWQTAWMQSSGNPWLFATGVMGFLPAGVDNSADSPQLEQWQDDFLRGFFVGHDGRAMTDARHSVRAGHGVGKGVVLAILGLWFPLTHYDSKCVITANSQDQLRDNNWAELRKWYQHLPQALRDQLDIQEERAVIRAAPEMAFVVRRTASKSNPEALQGIHAKHVLYLIDEASGIPDMVFEVAQGSLSTAGASAVLMSNPTRSSGFFFDTHNRLRDRWRTWRVSSADVPRAVGHIADIVALYGRGSNKYRVRVEGEFPTADDDTVISLALCEAARGREVAALDFVPVWGVDVGRFGDDSSALAKRQGNRLLEPVMEWHGKDTSQLTGLLMTEYARTDDKLRPSEILIDVIGIGAGVVDQCRDRGLPVRGVNVSESASADDKFNRLRDELWWRGREWFEARDCSIPADEKLIAELTGPTYDFSASGKIVIESKKDMKKRGIPSPNKADAFLNTFAGGLDRPIRPPRHSTQRRPAWVA